eukprot:scaffold2550_cov105-Pinguiococcus_pyrenoidosus.AAC.1
MAPRRRDPQRRLPFLVVPGLHICPLSQQLLQDRDAALAGRQPQGAVARSDRSAVLEQELHHVQAAASGRQRQGLARRLDPDAQEELCDP